MYSHNFSFSKLKQQMPFDTDYTSLIAFDERIVFGFNVPGYCLVRACMCASEAFV